MGRGYAFDVFDQIAHDETIPERAQLASVLGGALFEKARYAWSEPWATRMGWPGEEYGGNLLRIVLKPEAWVVVVKNGNLTVFDLQNAARFACSGAGQSRTPGRNLLPERRLCRRSRLAMVASARGSNGYREFIVGNLAMVEEWSLGTQQIRDRLEREHRAADLVFGAHPRLSGHEQRAAMERRRRL